MSFRLVLKSVTLDDLERRKGHYMHYFTEFVPTRNRVDPRSVAGFMHEFIVFCTACTMSS